MIAGRLELAALLLLGASSLAGCGAAAKMAEAPGARAASDEEPAKPAYERILGSFSVQPESGILLDPRLCERHLRSPREASDLAELAGRFASLGVPRGEAAAALNLSAVLWYRGEAEESYEQIMRATHLFAEAGDVDGLAHAHEWLGWYLAKSGATEQAEEHLAMSYRLYGLAGNGPAAQRVLGYGE